MSRKNLTEEEQRLPPVKEMSVGVIDGRHVRKRIFFDGSYGIGQGNEIIRYFSDNKQQRYVYDDAVKSYILFSEKLPDGPSYSWYSKGLQMSEKLPDGTYRYWHSNGRLGEEKLPDGTYHCWYRNGMLAEEKLPGGTITMCKPNGDVLFHSTKGVEDTEVYLAMKRVKAKKVPELIEKAANKLFGIPLKKALREEKQ